MNRRALRRDPRRWLLIPVLATSCLVILPGPVPAQQPEPACARPVAPNAPPQSSGTDPNLARAHALATGNGVRVAVIDTGVSPHPRLGEVVDGGDFIRAGEEPGGALDDCDGHGTVVAGVLAARPDPAGADGLVGVAPAAEILSIRQSSAIYRNPDDSPVGTVGSLAAAITVALDQGAQVISMSVVACVAPAAAAGTDTSSLDEALARAEAEQVVVVAAAGNLGGQCEPDSVVYPAHAPTVLAVAGLDGPHQIADYSVPVSAGPVLSAPGRVPLGLSSTGQGLAIGLHDDRETLPFQGTSFAAPVVAGTAALLRERHPAESAGQLRQRIFHSVDPVTGSVDPYRAVTFVAADSPPPVRQVAVTPPSPADQTAGRRAGWLGTALVVGLTLVGTLGGLRRRRNHPETRRY